MSERRSSLHGYLVDVGDVLDTVSRRQQHHRDKQDAVMAGSREWYAHNHAANELSDLYGLITRLDFQKRRR